MANGKAIAVGGVALVAALGAFFVMGSTDTGPDPVAAPKPAAPAAATPSPEAAPAPSAAAKATPKPTPEGQAELGSWNVSEGWPQGVDAAQRDPADDPAHQRFVEIAERSLARQIDDYTSRYQAAMSTNIGGAQARMVDALEVAVDEMNAIQDRVDDGEIDATQAFADLAAVRKRAIHAVESSAGDGDRDAVLDAMGEGSAEEIIGWGVPLDDVEFGELFK